MPAIKDISKISKKWIDNAQGAQGAYTDGVENPKKDWAKNTAAANDAYKQGIQKAIADDRFKKGVTKAGTEKWQRNTILKGPGRWAQGISQAGDAFETGFKPYADVIARTELPKRGAKGDPANINRVAVMAKALHDEKVKRKS